MTHTVNAAVDGLVSRTTQEAAGGLNKAPLTEQLTGAGDLLIVRTGDDEFDSVLVVHEEGKGATLYTVRHNQRIRTFFRSLPGARRVESWPFLEAGSYDLGMVREVQLIHDSLPGGRLSVSTFGASEEEMETIRGELDRLIAS